MIERVVSVAHSGTRTLAAHLTSAGLAVENGFWHFNRAYTLEHDYIGHIPVRDPLEVARSWSGRGAALDVLLESYGRMFEFIERWPFQVYAMHQLPRLAGVGESKPHPPDSAFIRTVRDVVFKPYRDFFDEVSRSAGAAVVGLSRQPRSIARKGHHR